MPKKEWNAEQSEDTNWWWIVSDSETGELGSGDGGFEEAEAKLMAAAPDLLEGVQGLLGIIEWLGTLPENAQKKVEAAKAAVAKANHREVPLVSE